MLTDALREEVVSGLRILDGSGGVGLHLNTGRGERQHLDINSASIHVGKPICGEIDEPAGIVL
jgi:hypothetical protein